MSPSTSKTVNAFLTVLLVLGLVAAFGLKPGIAAPPRQLGPQTTSGNLIILRAGEGDLFLRVPPPASPSGLRIQSATINVEFVLGSLGGQACSAWPSNAKTAFAYAVSIWESLITSSVPIEVKACWTPLGPGILGAAGANYSLANFSGAPVSDTWYPAALANKLAGSDLYPSLHDIDAYFSSSYSNWYFGTDGNTPAGKYDFVTVVLHELGHGLGFSGSMEVGSPYCSGSNGCWGDATYGYPDIYDRFTENGSGQSLINDFPNDSGELAAQLQSDNLYFDGTNARAANGGNRPKLYAPASWESGSSYSHLDETTYNGTANALMTPILNGSESIHNPGPITLGIFQDIGWEVETADLSIAQQVMGGSNAAPGDPITITLSIQNVGTSSATGVVVTDTLSSDILSPSWDKSSSLTGTTARGGTTYVWDLPDLAASASGVITVYGTIDPSLSPGFVITNAATIGSSSADTDASNNSSMAIIGGYRVYLPLVFNND